LKDPDTPKSKFWRNWPDFCPARSKTRDLPRVSPLGYPSRLLFFRASLPVL
jgi:hypothetical protein